MRVAAWIVASVSALLAIGPGCAGAPNPTAPTILYVWAGPRHPDGALSTPAKDDVLVAVDVDARKVVKVVDVGSANNEPHHVGRCGNHLFAGSLYSGRVFVFDVSEAASPKLVKTLEAKAEGFAVADDFLCLPGGRVLVTMMGTKDWGTPGGILEIAPDLTFGAHHPSAPDDALNPHDLNIDASGHRLVTTDFLEFGSIAKKPPAPIVRHTIRVWDLDTMTITATVKVCEGPMEASFLPHDPKGRIIVSCMIDGSFGLATPAADGSWSYTSSLDYDGEQNDSMPGSFEVAEDGRSVWVALAGYGEVRHYDLGDPMKPVLLATATVGHGSHYVTMSDDESQGYVSDYFLQLAEGPAMGPADDKLWHFDASSMKPDLLVDFGPHGTDPLLAGRLPLQPHGLRLR